MKIRYVNSQIFFMTAVVHLARYTSGFWLATVHTLRSCLRVPPRKVLRRLHLAGFHLLHQGGEPRRSRHCPPSPASAAAPRCVIHRELASQIRLCAPSADLLAACFAPAEIHSEAKGRARSKKVLRE